MLRVLFPNLVVELESLVKISVVVFRSHLFVEILLRWGEGSQLLSH